MRPPVVVAWQGQASKVAWVLRVAPTVLVKLGQRAAAAALEAGHQQVAQLILDAGGLGTTHNNTQLALCVKVELVAPCEC